MCELENLSESQLKERLEAELNSESPDRDVVSQILDLIKQRNPVQEIPVEVYEKWKNIRNETQNPKKFVHKAWMSVATTAAILALVIFLVPPAFGAENIFQLIGSWNKKTFSYTNPVEQPTFTYKTNHEGLQQVYDEVTSIGITENVVPTWLPEGYTLEQLVNKSKPGGSTVLANFTNGSSYITYSINISSKNTSKEYQKDDVEVRVFEFSEVKHYFFSNEGCWNIVWTTGNVECSLTVDDFDLGHKIIMSIYNITEE